MWITTPNLREIRDRYIRDVDLILTEGFKRNSQPKIEVSRKEKHRDLLCNEGRQSPGHCLRPAVSRSGVPCLDINDAPGLVDLIEEKILKGKKKAKVFLRVNGIEIPLSPFVQESIRGTVRGMVSSLKGCASPQSVEIQIFPD